MSSTGYLNIVEQCGWPYELTALETHGQAFSCVPCVPAADINQRSNVPTAQFLFYLLNCV